MAEKGGTAGADETVEYAPMVFQCQQCHRIVADSVAMTDPTEGPKANIDMGCISFSVVSESVVLGDQIAQTTNKDAIDFGCSFLPLSCGGCGSEIGKMYKATLPDFDRLRNLYTIDVNKVTNYSIGTGTSSSHYNIQDTLSELEALKNNVTKIREVLITLSQKVELVEEAIGLKEELNSKEEPDTYEDTKPADKKQAYRPKTPKHERPPSSQSRSNTHKTSYQSQSGYRSPAVSRTHGRKKARVATISETESD